MKFLSRQEELLLLAIWKLQDNAYGVPIRDLVIDKTGKYWSIGAIYDILDRLVAKELVITKVSAPTSERGGKSKRYYKIKQKGFEALNEVKHIQESLWSDLPKLQFKK